MAEETREALLAGHTRDLKEIRKLRAAAGGPYAVGDWVRSGDGHLVGEVVEVREGGPEEYVVRAPKVVIETSARHVVSGDDLASARVEDSHRHMAIDHLEYVLDEVVAAGRADALGRVWALAEDLAAGGNPTGEDGCEACGAFAHPSESCAGEEQGVRERVVAEAGLSAGAKIRVLRDEHADYFTEYSEGERASRVYQRSLDAALELFAGAVREYEDGDPAPTFEEDPEAYYDAPDCDDNGYTDDLHPGPEFRL